MVGHAALWGLICWLLNQPEVLYSDMGSSWLLNDMKSSLTSKTHPLIDVLLVRVPQAGFCACSQKHIVRAALQAASLHDVDEAQGLRCRKFNSQELSSGLMGEHSLLVSCACLCVIAKIYQTRELSASAGSRTVHGRHISGELHVDHQ